MKVAYVLSFDPTVNSGLWLRLIERLKVWAQLGVDVDVVIAARRDSALTAERSIAPHRLRLLTSSSSFSASHKLPAMIRMLRPDVVYMRYNLPYPGMVRVSETWPTVLEVHAEDTLEWKYRPLRYRWLAMMLRKRLLKNIDGLVLVDPGMADSVNFPVHDLPTLVLPNGIKIPSFDSYSKPRSRSAGPPRFAMAVGNNEPWHGIDKLAEIARLVPEFDFAVVGNTEPQSNLPGNLRLVGRVPASEMNGLLRGVDFGVGSLALERINRRYPSLLKVREYIAAGLPCILAADDPDLVKTDGTLQLGYGFTPNLRAAEDIRGFAAQWTGMSCPLEMARAVDVVAKEEKRIDFVRTILPSRAP